MATVTAKPPIDPANDDATDTRAVMDLLATGKPIDAETLERLRRDADRIRESIRLQHGVLDIGVPAIRELREA